MAERIGVSGGRVALQERYKAGQRIKAHAPRNGTERTLRSSLVTQLPVLKQDKLVRIDKLLISTLKDDSGSTDEYIFNFDRMLIQNAEGSGIELLNGCDLDIKDESSCNNLFNWADNYLSLDSSESSVLLSKSTLQHDQIDYQLLMEKTNQSIITVVENGNKRVSSHLFNLRSKSEHIKSEAKMLESMKDPLNDNVFSKYHKAKLKIEKTLASVDRTKFLDDVLGLESYFHELIHLLHSETRLLSTSYVNIVINACATCDRETISHLFKSVEYHHNSSFIVSYINYYHFQIHTNNDDRSPNYDKLKTLLEQPNNRLLENILNSEPNSPCLNLYEQLRELLIADKGYKEQYETGHMRNNSSVNFRVQDYELKEIKGAGNAVFNNLRNFEKLLVKSPPVEDSNVYISPKLAETLLYSSDRLLNDVDISRSTYPIQITAKDRQIIKLLRKLTYLNPFVVGFLDNFPNTAPEESILEQNLSNFKTFHQCLQYLVKIALLTLYETFKILSFFKSYWNSKNELLSYIRTKEALQVPRNFGCFGFCLSDPESESDSYSDPDDITLEELKQRRKSQAERKYIRHHKPTHLEESPSIKKTVLKINKDCKVVFSPRFGTKYFNTKELSRFEPPETSQCIPDSQETIVDVDQHALQNKSFILDSYEDTSTPLVDQQLANQIENRHAVSSFFKSENERQKYFKPYNDNAKPLVVNQTQISHSASPPPAKEGRKLRGNRLVNYNENILIKNNSTVLKTPENDNKGQFAFGLPLPESVQQTKDFVLPESIKKVN